MPLPTPARFLAVFALLAFGPAATAGIVPALPRVAIPRAAVPKPDEPPPGEPEDAATVADRVAKNAKELGDKLAANDTGEQTLAGQEKLKKDIDSLIKSLENPPPMSGGGGGGGGGSPPPPSGGSPPPPMGGGGSPMGGNSPMGGGKSGRKPRGGQQPRPMGGSPMPMPGSPMPMPGGGEKPMPGKPDKAPDGDGTEPGEKPMLAKPGGEKPGGGGMPGRGGQSTPALPLDEAIARDFWGNLPDLPRQRMMQFFREQYMSRYRDLLPQYYQSLAEKDKKGKK